MDSGIDYRMPDFRKEDGSSRILALWDQELEREFSQEQSDEALQAESRDGALELVPSIDRSGHGTAVAAIAAGSNPNLRLRGAAPGAGLLVVKLSQKQNGYPPVSYTHLDVYKRQVQYRECCGGRSSPVLL